ncbi:hypothetical protein BV898_17205 [Hypsibius exemplaris]|uniref:Uncharacterized protein n=1 Tax=Hypsibius exemplaris TaxID=2072580 RepID=A0A9X6RMD2_HYPEX|nr:hypothetical protein BV898_17205 [Hypsibius exemplaris]
MDVMTVLGVCAELVAPLNRGPLFTVLTQLPYGWAAMLFLSYATIWYLPFVFLHEESERLNRILRNFCWMLDGFGENSFLLTAAAVPAAAPAPADQFCPLRWATPIMLNCTRLTLILVSVGLAAFDTVDVLMSLYELEDDQKPFVVVLVQQLWTCFFELRGATML